MFRLSIKKFFLRRRAWIIFFGSENFWGGFLTPEHYYTLTQNIPVLRIYFKFLETMI